MSLPTEAEEIWRYSGIDDFELDAFAPSAPGAGDGAVARAVELADRFGPRSALVVTHQGSVLLAETAPGAPPGLLALPAGAQQAPGAGAEQEDAFTLLHEAFLPDVVCVAVPDGARLDAPVVVVHLADSAPDTAGEGAPGPAPAGEGAPGPAPPAPACFPHTQVRLGRQGEAAVLELLVPAAGGDEVGEGAAGPALVVPVTELDVGEGARLSYANVQVLGLGATAIASQRSRVARDGSLRSFTVGLGGRYARVRTDSELTGTGASSALLAAYLGVAGQVHDFRTLQDHHAPHTTSELLFTGAVADQARSVYSGLIRIRRGAKRADARQTNHNLVLSAGAHADSVPNLDIDENDVRCSHASTVGPIDDEQRYYLESRGIEPSAAERLIVLGFFSDIAWRAPLPAVGDWVVRAVADRLAGRLPAERGPAPATPVSAGGGRRG
jgi:Fe-S cluster assembly protein SufD